MAVISPALLLTDSSVGPKRGRPHQYVFWKFPNFIPLIRWGFTNPAISTVHSSSMQASGDWKLLVLNVSVRSMKAHISAIYGRTYLKVGNSDGNYPHMGRRCVWDGVISVPIDLLTRKT